MLVCLDNSVVGATIRRLRMERHMSQELLSGLGDIGRTHLTMIENGKKNPSLQTLWKLATALEMKPSELIVAIETACAANQRDTLEET